MTFNKVIKFENNCCIFRHWLSGFLAVGLFIKKGELTPINELPLVFEDCYQKIKAKESLFLPGLYGVCAISIFYVCSEYVNNEYLLGVRNRILSYHKYFVNVRIDVFIVNKKYEVIHCILSNKVIKLTLYFDPFFILFLGHINGQCLQEISKEVPFLKPLIENKVNQTTSEKAFDRIHIRLADKIDPKIERLLIKKGFFQSIGYCIKWILGIIIILLCAIFILEILGVVKLPQKNENPHSLINKIISDEKSK